jgi:hypothetical protein
MIMPANGQTVTLESVNIAGEVFNQLTWLILTHGKSKPRMQ